MISLKWEQVNAWRLSQHCLSQRVQAGDIVQAVRQTLGIHAQVMSAAEMAIGARLDGSSPQDVQEALWKSRSLVKTWAMRQTLHLVTAADFPIYIAARRITDINWPLLFDRNGINRSTFDAYLEVSPEILNREPLTRQQFAQAVGQHLKSPELRDYLANRSWGSPLKPLAWRGELCFGPSNGQSVTFVRPSAWIGAWQPADPEAAMQEIVRGYLRTYGPARPENFQLWWGTYIGPAKKAFTSISDEIETVDVEGWRSFALRTNLPTMQAMRPSGVVHILPLFDPYTVGLTRGKDLQRLFPNAVKNKVYRSQGWISSVILVDGFIRGTWEYKLQTLKKTITVNLFSSLNKANSEKLAAEAERLEKFLNQKIEIEFSHS